MARIVVAEDERDILDLIVFILQTAGHEVIPVNNGRDAVETVKREKPDLVLLDVRMPYMDGYEACKHIKEDPETASIPVVFLSARGQEGEIRTGLELGAEKYILKPFSPMQLLDELAPYLEPKA